MPLLRQFGGRLYRKYVVYFAALVGAVLLAGATSDLYFSYRKTRETAITLQTEKAAAAAIRIEQFIRGIEQHVGWTNLLPRGEHSLEPRQTEFIKLLRQAPAITDVVWLDASGREQLRVSRLAMDRVGSGKDFSLTPAFRQVGERSPYYGPVYFREGTEPYMTLAVPAGTGVTLLEINLKFVWDVVTGIRFGSSGHAYVVDRTGQLVSHPDISLVLKRTDLTPLPQVATALAAEAPARKADVDSARDLAGREVLSAHAYIEQLGWFVFVEQDAREAFAPLRAAMARTVFLMFAGLTLALVISALLARRMVRPIRAMQEGAARIGSGELEHRIDIHSGDELDALASSFNEMASRLRESYAGLEQKVAERTEELVAANRAKSRFLAAASHDLRQPIHALGLFVAQLTSRLSDPETRHLAGRIEAAVEALQGLLDALLDISRLDAGVVAPSPAIIPANRLLERIETAFAPEANDRGLHFRIVRTGLHLLSDPVLLERILLNLVANALRYTETGGILVGCRRRGDRVRFEVWDSGIGIPAGQQQAIFQEFYQLGNPERERGKGLGLGLSIASRTARLLGTRIEVRSVPGKGSVFAIELPRTAAPAAEAMPPADSELDIGLQDRLVLVVDDDPLVRDSIAGLLGEWGCIVRATGNGDEALAAVAALQRPPDAILCDYRLPREENGIVVVRKLHDTLGCHVPAALITGDTAPERLFEARESGLPLLHKPLQPARLRALLQFLVSTAAKKLTA